MPFHLYWLYSIEWNDDGEELIEKDVEGSACALFQGIILE
jgi:hypothetical protein